MQTEINVSCCILITEIIFLSDILRLHFLLSYHSKIFCRCLTRKVRHWFFRWTILAQLPSTAIHYSLYLTLVGIGQAMFPSCNDKLIGHSPRIIGIANRTFYRKKRSKQCLVLGKNGSTCNADRLVGHFSKFLSCPTLSFLPDCFLHS